MSNLENFCPLSELFRELFSQGAHTGRRLMVWLVLLVGAIPCATCPPLILSTCILMFWSFLRVALGLVPHEVLS